MAGLEERQRRTRETLDTLLTRVEVLERKVAVLDALAEAAIRPLHMITPRDGETMLEAIEREADDARLRRQSGAGDTPSDEPGQA